MAIFKRVEIWVVLVLLLGGIGYVVFTESSREGELPGAAADSEVPGAPFEIVGRELTRDYGNAKLEITLLYDNRGGTEIQPNPPDIRLVDADGGDVDPFFLAGEFPSPIPAGRKARATLAFWLKPEHFGQELSLCVRGDCVPVKSAAPFDLEAVENQATVSLGSADW